MVPLINGPAFSKVRQTLAQKENRASAKLIERSEPASPCIDTVLLTDYPKRPAKKLYDYVLLQAYPAGELPLPSGSRG